MMLSNRLSRLAACTLACSVLLLACGDKKEGAAGTPQQGAAPTVGVITVQTGQVPLFTELAGRLEASRIAQVRARTAGVVQKRLFREGGQVRQGQSLFQIDNAVQMASLQSAQASLARAEAALGQASDLARRYKPLVEAQAISRQEYNTALTNEKAARADVLAARAAVRNARIGVGYSQVLAPISGRIGRAQVTEGALVGQGEATLLATIQQTDPMVIHLSQSASEVMRLRQAFANGKAGSTGANPEVELVLEDGSIYPQRGRLLFSDAVVDPATGMVQLKAEVPNPDNLLLSGLYVRVRVQQARMEGAVLVPQQAVTRGKTDVVMVVNADGSFAPRPVQIGAAQGSQWVVTNGLHDGDQVIVDGLAAAMMRQAKKVTPQPWQGGKGAQAMTGGAGTAAAPATIGAASSAITGAASAAHSATPHTPAPAQNKADSK